MSLELSELNEIAEAIDNLAQSMRMMALCSLFDAGVLTLAETREELGISEMTLYRKQQLKRACSFTMERALHLPGYVLSEISPRKDVIDRSNTE